VHLVHDGAQAAEARHFKRRHHHPQHPQRHAVAHQCRCRFGLAGQEEGAHAPPTQLAQALIRSSVGKISLDTAFQERESLNAQIVRGLQEAAGNWGVAIQRCEVLNILPPQNIVSSLALQAEAERRKRAQVLESEGVRQAAINVAEGGKARAVLESEAEREGAINRAAGEAAAIRARAAATAEGLDAVAAALGRGGGGEAAALRVAEQYVAAFAGIAKASDVFVCLCGGGGGGRVRVVPGWPSRW
jgi:regulator of protease activity HflC (stomatin/prohibitin superfamily)